MSTRDLIERLEKAETGSAKLDAAVYLASEIQIKKVDQDNWSAPIPLGQYALSCVEWHGFQFTRDLGASARLIPKDRKGGWFWRVGHSIEQPGWAFLNRYDLSNCNPEDEISVKAATPELALCIAALKARTA